MNKEESTNQTVVVVKLNGGKLNRNSNNRGFFCKSFISIFPFVGSGTTIPKRDLYIPL